MTRPPAEQASLNNPEVALLDSASPSLFADMAVDARRTF